MFKTVLQRSLFMIIRAIDSEVAALRPYEVWNAYINLLAMEKYGDLNDVQRKAHLCFWYDSEVQNGGHLQYFENRGMTLLDETINALDALGAICQRDVLRDAKALFLSKSRDKALTAEQFVSAARENEFTAIDAAYLKCRPEIVEILKDYLEKTATIS